MFPDPEMCAKVKLTLETYGIEKHEQEPIRLRLAILKFSGNNFKQIARNTIYAKQDFRDILTWAEYPRQGKVHSSHDQHKIKKLRDADKSEYQQWLLEN